MTEARQFVKGIGQAVAERTITRKITEAVPLYKKIIEVPRRDDMALDDEVAAYAKSQGLVIDGYDVPYGDDLIVKIVLNVVGHIRTETWADVAERVARGSATLEPRGSLFAEGEYKDMVHHLRQASILMSGRHLQHGDETQASRNMEVFTNCFGFANKINTLEFGAIEIGKIAGERVHILASDGVWRIANVNSYGVQKLYRIGFGSKNGGKMRHEVTATANHRWLLNDGSVTESLKVGDVLRPAKSICERDPQAIVHGLIFGDGTAHKSRSDTYRTGVSYGRTYASIRVCKQDAAQAEIHSIFDNAGYRFTTPSHAKGDRVYYLGKFPFAKELPCSVDADYIEGFIYGWWLADGYKKYDYSDAVVISTVDECAVQWLQDYASYAGYSVVSLRRQDRKEGDGSFANGKPLYTVRLRKSVEWVVREIEEAAEETVYCVEEPVTKSFTLANGLLTGNCSTAAASFLTFYLLLNGSGVGRAYDDAMMVVDYAYLPIVVPVCDMMHKDVQSGEIQALDLRTAKHLYAGREIHVFEVPDSREGWAKAIEKMELMAFNRVFREDVLLLDFSKVRPRGAPIMGMQGRPASGPGALIAAIRNVAALREAGMAPWRSTMYADHYYAECVLVGGARRAARMATKFWKDPTVLDFIQVKRGGFLWSSNNSVTVDAEFWRFVENGWDHRYEDQMEGNLAVHALLVFDAICEAAYHDGTGEPGIINVDKLTWNEEGIESLSDGEFAESDRYKLETETTELTKALYAAWRSCDYLTITNPCGEIVLGSLGGYCVIADVVPFHADNTTPDLWDADAEDAFRTATRALIRTNTMNSLYGREVRRTNRIGVGITGFHEWAWARFGYGWKDIVNESKSLDMWLTMSRFKRAVQEEARDYAECLGVTVPHTNTTIKPAGCASLDTAIKTTEGVLTMRELFAKHGVTEEALRSMEDGTWIEPTVKTMVLDEGNVEREVTKLYLNGVKPVYEIEFEDGTVVKLTGNHKLKTVAGEWKRVDELTESDEILQF